MSGRRIRFRFERLKGESEEPALAGFRDTARRLAGCRLPRTRSDAGGITQPARPCQPDSPHPGGRCRSSVTTQAPTTAGPRGLRPSWAVTSRFFPGIARVGKGKSADRDGPASRSCLAWPDRGQLRGQFGRAGPSRTRRAGNCPNQRASRAFSTRARPARSAVRRSVAAAAPRATSRTVTRPGGGFPPSTTATPPGPVTTRAAPAIASRGSPSHDRASRTRRARSARVAVGRLLLLAMLLRAQP